jgi:hypothetical protein
LPFVLGALNTNGDAAADNDDVGAAVLEDDEPNPKDRGLLGAGGALLCDAPKPAKVKGVGDGVCFIG